MTGFREGETDRFPFDRTDAAIWYGIIDFDNGFHWTAFTSSKSGKSDFRQMISDNKFGKKNYLLVGIWMGQWRTDIFILDKTEVLKRIKK